MKTVASKTKQNFSPANIIAFSVLLIELLICVIIYLSSPLIDFKEMSVFALVQFIVNILILKICLGLPVISLSNLFAILSLFFHCGLIFKYGFNIPGSVPFPLERYGGMNLIRESYWFYIFSTSFLFAGFSCKSHSKRIPKRWTIKGTVSAYYYGKMLFLIGLFPMLYVDGIGLISALRGGYIEAASVYIPQPVQTLAFFADAGLFFLLLGTQKRRKQINILFLTSLYKAFTMLSGARQYKIATLVVLFIMFFFIVKKPRFKEKVLVFLLAILGYLFISIIGIARSMNAGTMGLTQVNKAFNSSQTNLLGSSLAEFGSAFETLELAVLYSGKTFSFGFGRTYFAGLLSAVPLIVRKIPFLNESVVYSYLIPQSIRGPLGGSYLGEFYYNFSWLGIVASLILGCYIQNLSNGIVYSKNSVYKAWSALSYSLILLFVRGYFTDMIQKLIWVYLMIWILWSVKAEKHGITAREKNVSRIENSEIQRVLQRVL